MHGLVNRSIQCFLRDTYGKVIWREVADAAQLGFDNFEALLTYEDELTDRILLAAADRLAKPVAVLLEDLGTYLISNTGDDSLRRLLRFGGETFVDFLHSLEELEERVNLALPEIRMPSIDVQESADGRFALRCRFKPAGFGHVVVGLLRAMADEYGALVILDHRGAVSGTEEILVDVLDLGFSQGRSFALGMPAA